MESYGLHMSYPTLSIVRHIEVGVELIRVHIPLFFEEMTKVLGSSGIFCTNRRT